MEHDPSEHGEIFQTLARESTLASQVTGKVEAFIVNGGFQPGDRFPPERELARQFGVSRTVIREAVRALVAKGLLEVRPGSGTFVRSPGTESVTQSMSLFLRVGQEAIDYDKIHEVRRLLEIEIAGVAATRHTDDDIIQLEAILAEVPHIPAGDGDRLAQNDVAFHAALARATHNELFVIMIDSIADVMLSVRQLGFTVDNMAARVLKYHRAILEQVKASDGDGARQAMAEHLIEAEDTMRHALAQACGGSLMP